MKNPLRLGALADYAGLKADAMAVLTSKSDAIAGNATAIIVELSGTSPAAAAMPRILAVGMWLADGACEASSLVTTR